MPSLRFCFFLLVFFSASLVSKDHFLKLRFVIWNIGQGQWTTLISEKFCDHFDVGGEHDVTKKVLEACVGKSHRIHLSHWDWDHMGLIPPLKQGSSNICLWNRPLGKASAKKESTLEGLRLCKENKPYASIYKGDTNPKASTNDSSQVIQINEILIPGDSPAKEEKIWATSEKNQIALSKTRGLILGHHGSKTSTSAILLAHLTNLKWAIATARKKRYGHPHEEVLARLKEKKIPILKTEDWGTIIFEL